MIPKFRSNKSTNPGNQKTYAGRHVVILGAARQGMATARFLLAAGAHVTLSDMRTAEQLAPVCAELDAFASARGGERCAALRPGRPPAQPARQRRPALSEWRCLACHPDCPRGSRQRHSAEQRRPAHAAPLPRADHRTHRFGGQNHEHDAGGADLASQRLYSACGRGTSARRCSTVSDRSAPAIKS